MSALFARSPATSPAMPAPLAHLERIAAALPQQPGVEGRVSAALWDLALVAPARDFLAEPGKGFRARIVALGYQLGGGAAGGCPPELAVALEWMHAGSLIVDDIEDDATTRRGKPALHLSYGLPRALNTGNWLYFAALQHLAVPQLPAETTARLQATAIRALAACHCGQALDLAARVDRLAQREVADVVAATTALKTAALMGLAAELGAIAAGADAASTTAIAAFGHDLGVGLQMLDDLGSVVAPSRAHKGAEDLRGGHPTWPWAWLAHEVDPFTWARLMAALRAVGQGGDVTALLVELRARLQHAGPSRPAAHLSRALAALRGHVGEHAALAAIEAELVRLVAAYD